jgi:hypothetical protein
MSALARLPHDPIISDPPSWLGWQHAVDEHNLNVHVLRLGGVSHMIRQWSLICFFASLSQYRIDIELVLLKTI